jgi:hypothetical protein
MTPARKAALQWFHDRGVVFRYWTKKGAPTPQMIRAMIRDGQLSWDFLRGHSLTDRGRRALHGDDK